MESHKLLLNEVKWLKTKFNDGYLREDRKSWLTFFYHHFTTVFDQKKGYGKPRNPLYLNGRDERI